MLVSTLGREAHPIPHEPNETMTFRPLTGPEMEDCEAAVLTRGINKLGDAVEAFSKIAEDRKAEKSAQTEAPTEAEEFEKAKGEIDAQTALPLAIVGWSYKWPDVQAAPGIVADMTPGEPIPVNPGTVADLDERTWAWALEVVVRMNKILPQNGSGS